MAMDYKSFFPDCDECGTNVFVSRTRVDVMGTFVCEFCGDRWCDDEFDTLIDEFEHRDIRLFILRSAGGYEFEDIAVGTGWKVDTVRRRYNKIRDELTELTDRLVGTENIENPYLFRDGETEVATDV